MPYKDPERRREYQREWCARRRSAWLDGKYCVDCGATDNLEVDHVNPQAKVSHRIWSWSQERRERELRLCVVRCEVCHRERHADLWTQHGTRKRYEKGCRCNLCKLAASNRARREYARKKKAA
jgi:hypothetical protein